MDNIIRNTTYPRKLRFKEFDFYSEGAHINVEGNERNKNWFGAIISLSIYILIGLASYYYFLKFLDETNPKIQFNAKTEPVSYRFNMAELELYPFLLISNPSASKDLRYSNNQSLGDSSDNSENRRVLQATSGNNSYLDYSSVGTYFKIGLEYRLIQYKQTPSGDFIETTTIGNRSLVPCSNASWVNNPRYQESLSKSSFALELIKRYGICMDVGDNSIISGDGMSRQSARLSFTLGLCNSTDSHCDAGAWEKITAAADLGVIFGTFES